MSAFMNDDQPATTASFWDSYLNENKALEQSELSAANLQSFDINDSQNILLDQFTPNLPNIENNNGFSFGQPRVPSESLSMSTDTSTTAINISQNLNQLIDNINETQKEVTIIKQELNEDGSVPDLSNNKRISSAPKTIVEKRKSQNRAAQRAFRERKEQKLKELEKKLEASEVEKNKLVEEMEKLKLKNIIITTENQMLLKNKAPAGTSSAQTPESKADTVMSPTPQYDGDFHVRIPRNSKFTFPSTETNKSLNEVTVTNQDNISEGECLVYEDPDESDNKLLSMPAVWDYVNKFEDLNPQYDIDIQKIMDDLEGLEKCHGLGPAFSLKVINRAISKQILSLK